MPGGLTSDHREQRCQTPAVRIVACCARRRSRRARRMRSLSTDRRRPTRPGVDRSGRRAERYRRGDRDRWDSKTTLSVTMASADSLEGWRPTAWCASSAIGSRARGSQPRAVRTGLSCCDRVGVYLLALVIDADGEAALAWKSSAKSAPLAATAPTSRSGGHPPGRASGRRPAPEVVEPQRAGDRDAGRCQHQAAEAGASTADGGVEQHGRADGC